MTTLVCCSRYIFVISPTLEDSYQERILVVQGESVGYSMLHVPLDATSSINSSTRSRLRPTSTRTVELLLSLFGVCVTVRYASATCALCEDWSLALDLYRTIVRWHYFCTKAYVFSTCSYWLGKVVIGNLLSTLMVHTIYAIVSYGM